MHRAAIVQSRNETPRIGLYGAFYVRVTSNVSDAQSNQPLQTYGLDVGRHIKDHLGGGFELF